MTNFLFEDLENGGYFFVQCYNELEIEEILIANDIDPDEVVLVGEFSDHEAEILGYDTY